MLTVDLLDQMTRDDRWAGFGYLGERDRTDAGAAVVAAADAAAVQAANAAGLDYEGLFAWANGKQGRWYGDCVFGAHGQHAQRYLPR